VGVSFMLAVRSISALDNLKAPTKVMKKFIICYISTVSFNCSYGNLQDSEDEFVLNLKKEMLKSHALLVVDKCENMDVVKCDI
jgi:hypothetical protein